ncbi:MAG: DUF4393 domain-containing protein [Tagaea sp.]|nr:DUF4393 domain-containing protein [Tagaea sp.]
MKPRAPKKPQKDKKTLFEVALRPVAEEFGQNSKGLGKKLAKAAVTTADIVNGLLTMAKRAPSTLTSSGREFGRKFGKLFSGKIEKIPADRRIRPIDAIAIPTLQSLALRIDEPEIAEMFANLLCAAMDRESAGRAHPAFASVVSEMVSDEAKILRYVYAAGAVPVVNVLSGDPSKRTVRPTLEGLSLAANKADAGNKGFLPVHTANLVRLGLVAIPVDEVLDDSRYEALENSPPIRALASAIRSSGRTVELQRRQMRLTEFGRAFLRVCLPDEK